MLEVVEWIIDSGCTAHMCFDFASFKNLVPHETRISLPDGSRVISPGYGDVGIFKDVLFVPNFGMNLL